MEDDLVSEDDILLCSEKEFHDAARRNDTGKMQELIKMGVNVKAKNKIDRKALHWAAGAGSERALRMLLEHDTEVNERDSFGMTALLLASWFGHLKVLQTLVSCGAKLNSENNMLHCAAQRGHIKSGKTALHLAAEHGQFEVVEFLIGMGCTHENTAMHLAARSGHTHILQKMVEMGVDVDERNKEGLTALHLASDGAHCECVRLLLEAGCEANALTNKNMTALHYAAQHGSDREASLLLEAGTHRDAVDTTQHSSAPRCVPPPCRVLRLLIGADCDLDLADRRQQTALHIAAEHGWQDLAEMMLISGVDLNLTDKGKTCLEVAARGNHVILVDMILKADRFYKWEKGAGLLGGAALSFKQDHQQETQHLRSVLWSLATKHLCRGEWKILAQHWDFSEAHIRADAVSLAPRRGDGGENPVKGLYEGLVEISRTDLAESIRQKANAENCSPKLCSAM
ncbi:hypothetical protein F7725_027039 [Dissostichus mawsoni]|uniref:Ankyrin repeat and death domain-containing protein 1A n=1 Tax=Dissostichus mawsoni TaxID=36200 RepID=A0A7J5X8P3_DISMA|nr:hypothetical protein F7725_027039 [Dissostichus mawsoni]